VGDFDPVAPVIGESPLKYHPDKSEYLTSLPKREKGQCLVGSLTGAVASKKVTEAYKGSLRLNGNQSKSAKA
jgi:Family of unknown function (DUF6467)